MPAIQDPGTPVQQKSHENNMFFVSMITPNQLCGIGDGLSKFRWVEYLKGGQKDSLNNVQWFAIAKTRPGGFDPKPHASL